MTLTGTQLRPLVHFTAETGWINDPHGVYFLDGRYHLFFQHVPDSLDWRTDIHWGHATSTDLLHWRQEPTALPPGDGDDGCWSGGAAVGPDGRPVLFYTSVSGADHQLGRVRIARPAEDGGGWTKGEVVADAPGPTTRVFRDPMVLRDRDRWLMVVGSGSHDRTAGAELFSSEDLTTWRYDGVLAARNTRSQHPWTGSAWECPQLIRGGRDQDQDVLVVSIWDDHAPHDVAAATGTFDGGEFTVDRWQLVSGGQGHFAATAFTDEDGRACLLFWIRGIVAPGQWAGALSVPYVVTATAGQVVLAPHPALLAARVDPDGPGTSLDVQWTPGPLGRLALVGADGQDRAVVEAADGRLRISTSAGAAPVEVTHGSPTLRLIADAQVLEVVADGGLVGLPLTDTAGGLEPRSDQPDSLAWWHLT